MRKSTLKPSTKNGLERYFCTTPWSAALMFLTPMSAHGQHMVSTWSAHGQHMATTPWSAALMFLTPVQCTGRKKKGTKDPLIREGTTERRSVHVRKQDTHRKADTRRAHAYMHACAAHARTHKHMCTTKPHGRQHNDRDREPDI